MKYPERVIIVENLSQSSRAGYIAFCVNRCLNEARRHSVSAAQLEKLPLLLEGLEMLWVYAEQEVKPALSQIEAVFAHLQTYERPAADAESVVYDWDVTLVHAARMLAKGLHFLQDPYQTSARYVAGALEGAVQSVGTIYVDWQSARKAELEVIDTALQRLQKWGDKPFSRVVFDGIPDWPRGELSKKYAEGRLKGSAEDDE